MITDEQWNWLWENYEIPGEDKSLHLRREIYEHLILIWWCLRTLQYIIEIATGRGKRLVDASNISLEEKQEQFWYYFEMVTDRYLNKP